MIHEGIFANEQRVCETTNEVFRCIPNTLSIGESLKAMLQQAGAVELKERELWQLQRKPYINS
jgi:hypothetical protein